MAGIGPLNTFPPRYSDSRLVRLPSAGGIAPLNAFPPRLSPLRLARLPNAAGIGPLNAFPPRYSNSRLVRLPSAGGIGPLNAFPLSSSALRLARLPSAGGIGPLNAFSLSPSHRTRPAVLVATPYHSLSGASVFQLVLSVQLGPPVASYKASSAARSAATPSCATASAAGIAQTTTLADSANVNRTGFAEGLTRRPRPPALECSDGNGTADCIGSVYPVGMSPARIGVVPATGAASVHGGAGRPRAAYAASRATRIQQMHEPDRRCPGTPEPRPSSRTRPAPPRPGRHRSATAIASRANACQVSRYRSYCSGVNPGSGTPLPSCSVSPIRAWVIRIVLGPVAVSRSTLRTVARPSSAEHRTRGFAAPLFAAGARARSRHAPLCCT